MVSSFICGTSSLPREDDEYERQTRSAGSSPRSSRSSKSNKNPYSTRGLDKFSALLAEIEEKRQEIYNQLDPEEISLVRFVYSDDHNVKPIVVVKPKPKTEPDKPNKPELDHCVITKLPSSSSLGVNEQEKREDNLCKKKKMGIFRKLRVYKWNEPKFYLPMILILILMILVLFGRSFAIMCTSIGWYVIPTITNNGNQATNQKKLSFKKKDSLMLRRLSANKKMMASEGTTSFKGI